MKKIWKRTIAMLLVVLMIGGAAPLGALAEMDWPTLPDGVVSSWVNEGIGAIKNAAAWLGERLHGLSLRASAETQYSGTCGAEEDNLTWTLDTETGVLTISGTGAMKDYNGSAYVPWYYIRKAVKSIAIKNGVTSIGKWTFDTCTSLTCVTIPNSVTRIGEWAFYNCESLVSVTIPDSVMSIGWCAFTGCDSLTNITIPGSVISFGYNIFSSCHNLTRAIIQDGVTIISNGAFTDCTSLKSVTIPSSVTNIDKFAFSDCTSLKSVTIPDGVTIISNCAFFGCTGLTSMTIPNSVTSIWSSAFYGCTGLTSVTIGNSVTSIGDFAFCRTGLTNVTIGNSVTSIGTCAFSDCTRLTDVFYGGSQEDWAKIRIGSSNTPLQNATIHYNSFGPTDPGNGDEPNKLVSEVTYDQDYYWTGEGFFGEHAAVTDSLEFYVKLENSAPIALLNPAQTHEPKTFAPITMTVTTNARTLTFDMDGTQHSYSVTFDALDERQTVDDLILLYPQNGFSAEREYTVTITYSCEDFDTITETYSTYVHTFTTDPIQAHINYISGDSSYRVSKRNINGQYISELRSDAEYQWSKYTSFDFDNYYKVVVADLVGGMLNTAQLNVDLIPNYIKKWKKNLDSVRKGLNTMVFDQYGKLYDVSELKIDKLIKCSKYTDKGIWTEDLLYQAVVKMFGNTNNIAKITKIFAAADKLNMWNDVFKWGVNVINDTFYGINKLTLLESFSDADDSFKAVLQNFYAQIPNSETKMKNAVYDYLMYDSGDDGRFIEQLTSICDVSWNITMDTFKSVIGKKMVDYLAAKLVSWAGTHIMVATSNGTVALGSTAAFGTISSVASGFFAGVSLGLAFSEILCDSSSKAKEMAKAISMAEYAKYIVMTLSSAETYLQNTKSSEALDRFEYAFAMHKSAQVYIAEHTIKALEYKRDSIAYKLFGNKKTADEAIKAQLEIKSISSNLKCHSDSLPMVFSDTTTKRKIIAVKCPVNVSVYNQIGNEVIRIVNNSVEFAADGIEYAIYESDKYFLIPDTDGYNVKITATDQGTMAYSVSEWEDGEWIKEYGKADISLAKGQVFTGVIPKDSAGSAQDYNLKTNGITINVETIADAEKTYTVKWIVDDKATTETVSFGAMIVKPADPTKEGYTFKGWTPAVPATMPAKNMTFTAVFEKDSDPIVVIYTPSIQIANYEEIKTVDYRTTITFTADADKVYDGEQVHWFIDGQDKGASNTYTVKEAKKNFTVQAKYMKDGKVISESEIETVKVNAGFFARLKAFFRALFGRLPKVVQEYLGVEIIDRVLP